MPFLSFSILRKPAPENRTPKNLPRIIKRKDNQPSRTINQSKQAGNSHLLYTYSNTPTLLPEYMTNKSKPLPSFLSTITSSSSSSSSFLSSSKRTQLSHPIPPPPLLLPPFPPPPVNGVVRCLHGTPVPFLFLFPASILVLLVRTRSVAVDSVCMDPCRLFIFFSTR